MERESLKLDAFFAVACNNTDFVKQLLIALSDELILFEKTIKDVTSFDELECFRKAAHKVLPGLKMLEQSSLLNAIEQYKEECNKEGRTLLTTTTSADALRTEVAFLLNEIRFFCSS